MFCLFPIKRARVSFEEGVFARSPCVLVVARLMCVPWYVFIGISSVFLFSSFFYACYDIYIYFLADFCFRSWNWEIISNVTGITVCVANLCSLEQCHGLGTGVVPYFMKGLTWRALYATQQPTQGNSSRRAFFPIIYTFHVSFAQFCNLPDFPGFFFSKYVKFNKAVFFLLLENITNSDRTPPYLDTYLQLFPNFENSGQKALR